MEKTKQQGHRRVYTLCSLTHEFDFLNPKYIDAESTDLDHLKEMFEAWATRLWSNKKLLGFALVIQNDQGENLFYIDDHDLSLCSLVRDYIQPFALEYGFWVWLASQDLGWELLGGKCDL